MSNFCVFNIGGIRRCKAFWKHTLIFESLFILLGDGFDISKENYKSIWQNILDLEKSNFGKNLEIKF